MSEEGKPPYRIPLMAEVEALPWNGLNVVSTFSGCGGSSLGYRLAGCHVLAASEFVPAAAEVYRMNCAPYTKVDTRDIRTVSGKDLLDLAGLGVGELDILDGSPPCASFSTAGKREAGWGKVRSYSDTKQRVDDLFYEFSRVLGEMQPRAFIAENVAGLTQGVAKGYFMRIFRELEAQGYKVAARVLDAQWLGVPQSRSRTIFVGIRNDLGIDPQHPTPFPFRYSMGDALPHLTGQLVDNKSRGTTWADKTPTWRDADEPSKTVGASPVTGSGRYPMSIVGVAVKEYDRTVTEVGIEKVSPIITASGMGRNQSEVCWLSADKFGSRYEYPIGEPSPVIMAHGLNGTAPYQTVFVLPADDGRMLDPETGYDLGKGVSPLLLAAYPGRALRRMSLGEVRRLCSFPDDFQLAGSYQKRWERLGRAVPPMMMRAVALKVKDLLTQAGVPSAG